jgi:vancomycin resistance protein VanJ
MKKRRKDKRRKGGLRFFGITSRALMSVAAALLVVSYLSLYVNPAHAWFMTVFGLLFVPLALLNVFLLLWAIARRSRAVLIPLLALLPAFLLSGRYFQFGKSAHAQADGGRELKVLSYNVGRFASASKSSGVGDRKDCADSVFALIKELDPDIVCLQEFYISDARRAGDYLARRFRGYNIEYFVYPTSKGCYGNVTLSRFPIVSKSRLDFDASSNLAISCDVDMDGTLYRIYNCHFQSYSLSLASLAAKLRGDYREAVRYTEDRMRRSISLRPKQVDMVMSNVEESPVESFVVGDFNDVPISYTYQRLSRGRTDSFTQAGRGTGATYAGLRPFLRIDYVLFPTRFRALSHEVLHEGFSDHYPIMTRLELPAAE